MVGGHPSCQIRIDKPGTPDLVYIVFSFNETIEVWPTTAIAFPRWGALAADQLALQQMGGDLQRPNDNGGGNGQTSSSQRDLGTQRAQLLFSGGQTIPSRPAGVDLKNSGGVFIRAAGGKRIKTPPEFSNKENQPR